MRQAQARREAGFHLKTRPAIYHELRSLEKIFQDWSAHGTPPFISLRGARLLYDAGRARHVGAFKVDGEGTSAPGDAYEGGMSAAVHRRSVVGGISGGRLVCAGHAGTI